VFQEEIAIMLEDELLTPYIFDGFEMDKSEFMRSEK
jgi:hypothetical protein